MSNLPTVLVVCRHNSGRSRRLQIESAGLEPAAAVNPLVVAVMAEEGFDLSARKPQSVFELFKRGALFDHIVAVCSETEGQCPTYPGITRRWHMPFPDPAGATGTHEEKMEQVRAIRDMIKVRLQSPGPGDFDVAALLDVAE